jgi:hypothetical protein
MRRKQRVMFSGLLILAMGRPLGAQQPVTIEGGIAGANFPTDGVSAGGPYLRLLASRVERNLFGSLDAGAVAALGASTGYASLRGGWRSGAGVGFTSLIDGELSTVAGSSHNGAAGTGIGSARAMYTIPNGGLWLRASGHRSARTNTTLGGGGVDATAWYSFPRAELSASVTQEWTRAELYTGSFRTGFVGTAPVRYTEGALGLHAESDRTSLDVSGALRRDPDAEHLWENAISVTAAVWTGDRVAFVVGASKQLPDWIRGADAAETFTIGLRFRQSAPEVTRATRILPVVQVTDGDTRVLRIRAAGASRVEVMGDFTDWESRALVRSGDVFEAQIPLSSGSHRLLVRVNGGPWKAAVNTPVVDDDLGGKVGLLVVP